MKKLDFEKINKLFSCDYTHNMVTRERAAADNTFFWITHWDDSLLSDSQLQYRGEFDLLRKAFRDIMSDLRANPVQADFEPVDGAGPDEADLIDGIYRTDCRKNTSKEAFDYASIEQVVCGLGGWRLCTEYESDNMGTRNQVIVRKPIYEFNNCVFFDSNAKRIDKSDAKRCTVLTAYSVEGYCDLVEEITGERPDEASAGTSFATPEDGYSFPWLNTAGTNTIIWVGEFYHRYKAKVRIQYLQDPLGELQVYTQEAGKKAGEVDDDLLELGFMLMDEKEIDQWVVDKYLLSGDGIIGKPERIAGKNIPIVPEYGDRAYIQGVEHYEGIVKAAKDPQMLRDFAMSYLADIVGRSPRVKPVYLAEQIQGFQYMYEETGADNNYAYLLQNRLAPDGTSLPIGPVAQTPEQPVPTALSQLMGEVRMAVEDVANPGLPNSISDPDLSGKALNTLVAQFDQQSMVFQENRKYAIRRDAEIYASIASEILDVPRKVITTSADGNRKEVNVMQSVIDMDSGKIKVLNDLRFARFEVYADVSKPYSTGRQEAREALMEQLGTAMSTDPQLAQIIQLKLLRLQDGQDMEDLRDWAGVQLVLRGIRKPESDEEKQALADAQAQQGQQQDPNMALAMAEQMKAENGAIKNQIDEFRAQTDLIAVMIDAEKAGADINYKQLQGRSLMVNDAVKLRGSANGMQ